MVSVCGYGAGAHYAASLLAARGRLSSVFVPNEKRAFEWNSALESNGGLEVHHRNGRVSFGKPHISHDPSFLSESKVVLIIHPASAHRSILKQIAPHLNEKAIICGFPAQSGFDWEVSEFFEKKRTVVGLDTFPWACVVKKFGASVTELGRKRVVRMVVDGQTDEDTSEAERVVAGLVRDISLEGHSSSANIDIVRFKNFLSFALCNESSLVHPIGMYGHFCQKENETQILPTKYFDDMTPETVDLMIRAEFESRQVADSLSEKMGVNLTSSLQGYWTIHQFLASSYPHEISDPGSLYSCFKTNKVYQGFSAPVVEEKKGPHIHYRPNFDSRYISEDISCGLLINKGLAMIAGVNTPVIDSVIEWCQRVTNKNYLQWKEEESQWVLQEKSPDVQNSRAPQVRGIQNIYDLCHRYPDSS